MRKVTLVTLAVVFLCLSASGKVVPRQDEGEARRMANEYFERQKGGRDVSDMFCLSRDAVSHFNVKSHEIQTVDCNDFECKVRCYVQSTTAGNREIAATWEVAVRTRPDRSCINSVRESN